MYHQDSLNCQLRKYILKCHKANLQNTLLFKSRIVGCVFVVKKVQCFIPIPGETVIIAVYVLVFRWLVCYQYLGIL